MYVPCKGRRECPGRGPCPGGWVGRDGPTGTSAGTLTRIVRLCPSARAARAQGGEGGGPWAPDRGLPGRGTFQRTAPGTARVTRVTLQDTGLQSESARGQAGARAPGPSGCGAPWRCCLPEERLPFLCTGLLSACPACANSSNPHQGTGRPGGPCLGHIPGAGDTQPSLSPGHYACLSPRRPRAMERISAPGSPALCLNFHTPRSSGKLPLNFLSPVEGGYAQG